MNFKPNPLTAKTINPGQYVHFKTGKNCQSEIEHGDLLQGMWIDDNANEVFGTAQLTGFDKLNPQDYTLITSHSLI